MKSTDGGGGWFFICMAASVIAIMLGLVSVTTLIGPASIPIWGAAFVFGFLALKGPLGHAIAARLGAPQLPSPERVDVPEEVYAELDELRARMLEMEERQDFSERLLAGRHDAPADPAPGGER